MRSKQNDDHHSQPGRLLAGSGPAFAGSELAAQWGSDHCVEVRIELRNFYAPIAQHSHAEGRRPPGRSQSVPCRPERRMRLEPVPELLAEPRSVLITPMRAC
jgi:hypothetical protein